MKKGDHMNFDVSKAKLSNKAEFKPFQVDSFIENKTLIEKGLIKQDEGILVFEYNKKHYGLLTKQMTYHHVANGDIDGEPFMISF